MPKCRWGIGSVEVSGSTPLCSTHQNEDGFQKWSRLFFLEAFSASGGEVYLERNETKWSESRRDSAMLNNSWKVDRLDIEM